MKKTYVFLFIITLCLSAFSQTTNTDFEIYEAIFYPNEVLFKSSKEIPLNKGQNHIVVKNLPSIIDETSLNFWSNDDITLLNIEFKMDPSTTKLYDLYKDSISIVDDKIGLIEKQYETYQVQQDEIIKYNKNISASNKALDANESIKWLNYTLAKSNEILIIKDSLKHQLHNLAKKKELLSNLIENQLQNTVRGQLDIQLDNPDIKTKTFNLSYIVNNAGWKPIIEVNYLIKEGSIQIIEKAQMFQSSGLELNNLNTFVFKDKPQTTLDRPLIFPMYYSYQQNNNSPMSFGLQMTSGSYNKEALDKEEANSTKRFETYIDEVRKGIYDEKPNKTDNAKVANSLSSQKVNLGKRDFKNNQNYTYSVSSIIIKAPVFNLLIPRKDNSTYIIAKLKKDGTFSRDSATIKLFTDNHYIGRASYVSDIAADSILLPIGINNLILSEYIDTETTSKEQSFGKYKFTTKSYLIAIKNNNPYEVNLNVIDQIPIGKSGIEVRIIENSGGMFNSNNGKITWDLDLQAHESRILKVVYAIKYEKDRRIYINE
jgi:uncharacterized protein (TIGR02231 family)